MEHRFMNWCHRLIMTLGRIFRATDLWALLETSDNTGGTPLDCSRNRLLDSVHVCAAPQSLRAVSGRDRRDVSAATGGTWCGIDRYVCRLFGATMDQERMQFVIRS